MGVAEHRAGRGLALGAWGAAQWTGAGVAIALGGAIRDWTHGAAMSGQWGEALHSPATGYSFVYHTEIGLLFATLVILGPLVRHSGPIPEPEDRPGRLGLADFPT